MINMEITSAQYYVYIYMMVVTIFSFRYLNRYWHRIGGELIAARTSDSANGWLTAIFFILFIGTRPINGDVFNDMPQYLGIYETFSGSFEFTWDTNNFIYDNLMLFLASMRFAPEMFYILIAAIYFGGTFYAMKKIFPRDYLVAYIVWAGAFSTFAYGTNGIKAGIATVPFLLAIAFRHKWIVWIPMLIISLGIHHSMQLPIAAYLITRFYRDPKYFLIFWAICVLLAAAHVSYFQTLFAGMTDDHGAKYLVKGGLSAEYYSGFRIDFVLYSAMPVLMSWYCTNKQKIQSPLYDTLTCIYLLVNGVWMLCMYASYTNRIAYLSWFMYPIVLCYPVLSEDWKGSRYQFFAKIATFHILFSLVMLILGKLH